MEAFCEVCAEVHPLDVSGDTGLFGDPDDRRDGRPANGVVHDLIPVDIERRRYEEWHCEPFESLRS